MCIYREKEREVRKSWRIFEKLLQKTLTTRCIYKEGEGEGISEAEEDTFHVFIHKDTTCLPTLSTTPSSYLLILISIFRKIYNFRL